MTIPERIYHFLMEHAPASICEDCIAKGTAVTQRQLVNPITGAFGLTSDFEKSSGECRICKNVKLTTKAVRHAKAPQ